ncbi:MAG TPA: diaminopimelate epimerase [Longimicrobiaceae bacterium]|nr:diaminopimelate epimerase [Longimicrobiaceae bacterium]
MRMRFFKAHGLGNDYLALDLGELGFEPAPGAVRLLCDRNRGVGSDGVLARVPSARADFGVRIFNPDGSEAEKSGNGLRIFAAYLLDLGAVREAVPFTVDTLGGLVTMTILSVHADSLMVEAEMGRASFRSGDVGLAGPDRVVDGEMLELEAGDRVTINTVSVGNPHCVIFEDELDPEDLRRRAPQVSTHPFFARGTNVQFARAVAPAAVEAWVWERGAGETQASGSSACAVAAAAVRRGLVSERIVEVRMPGGDLHVTVGEDWSLTLRGPVEVVYRGELAAAFVSRLRELS